MNGKIIGIILGITALLALGAYVGRGYLLRQFFAPQVPENARQLLPTADTAATPDTASKAPSVPNMEVVASDLTIPWELVFLPSGEMLVTERPGRLLKIGTDKTTIPISGVQHIGEGGLLGMALHPNFAQNQYLYLYLTTQTGNGLTNRVERYTFTGTALTNRTPIIENIPGAQYHDGGRIAFGPDGLLYITTGDAGVEESSQDTSNLAGKILRVRDDGSIPADNPFGNAVYSYGHRNPQGLTWDNAGNLWATEHGRSGARSGFDEVNLIEAGKNYGWPTIEGDETRAGMETPRAHSGATTTWAPSGMTFFDGNLLFAGLRGQSLYKAEVDAWIPVRQLAESPGMNRWIPDQVRDDSGGVVQNNDKNAGLTVIPYAATEFGRLRTVTVGPDGLLYILTNNQDGRGTPRPGDDKIIRLNPAILD